ncbi:glycosyltransferase [Bacillus sp. AFS033286]|uniref:glycosyltransferase n=1 Tax=Bacillus sp. AFS033286 TaxID=2033498 RepID=UPI000BFC149E|nr:glycosyltransferase [Bacillus sp. AFS033286]PGX10516.1 hypothetical protein COE07_14230 [Bacillus sp. AFS033286]
MHVLCIASWYPTKSEPLKGTFFQEQFEALAKQGVKVTVLAIDFRSFRKVRKWGLSYSVENNIETFRLSLPLGPLPIGIYKMILSSVYKYVYNVITRKVGKIDIIHAHAVNCAGILGRMMGNYSGIPMIVTEHSTGLYKVSKNHKEKNIYRETYNSAEKVISVSPAFSECIAEIKGDQHNIMYIPNMIDFKHFYNRNNREKEFVFISIGFLTFKKGMDIVIKGFAEFNDKYPNSILKIVGHGQELENLQTLTKKLKKENSIEFVGAVARKDLPEVLSTANCLSMGSRLETFGLIFIEALACGLPIIGTACDGPKVIINEKNGIIVEIDCPEEMSKAMKSIYENYNKYNPDLIREDAERKYSENSVSKRIVNLYKQV